MPKGTSRYDEAALQGRLWTPRCLPPRIWCEAADGSSVVLSTGVSTWNNRGTSTTSIAQATGANQPAYSPADQSLACGVSKYFDLSAITMLGRSAFVVVKMSSSTSDYRALMFDGQISRYPMIFNTGTTTFGIWNGSFQTSGYSLAASTKGILYTEATNNGGSSVWSQTINGQALAVTVSNLNDVQPNRLFGDGASRPSGDISEFIYTDLLSTRDRQLFEGYLAWKWWDRLGQVNPLPGTHPFKLNPPLIGG